MSTPVPQTSQDHAPERNPGAEKDQLHESVTFTTYSLQPSV
jgi:hypothetical protein